MGNSCAFMYSITSNFAKILEILKVNRIYSSLNLGVHLALLVPLGYGVGNILKNLFCVERPKSSDIWLGRIVNEDDYGFPSTHCTFQINQIKSSLKNMRTSLLEMLDTFKTPNTLFVLFCFVLFCFVYYSSSGCDISILSDLLCFKRFGHFHTTCLVVFLCVFLVRSCMESTVSRCSLSWRCHFRRCCWYHLQIK
jgi:hypothetical protein